MTLETWLRERQPAPPPRLMDRMCGAAVASEQASNADIVGGARTTALHLLQTILAQKNASRSAALDLLAADALMTYSCEAACDQPETLLQAANGSIDAALTTHKVSRDAAAGRD